MIVPTGGKPAAVTFRPKPDVSAVINLIEVSVAPGTWKVPDEQGGMVPTKVKARSREARRNGFNHSLLSLSELDHRVPGRSARGSRKSLPQPARDRSRDGVHVEENARTRPIPPQFRQRQRTPAPPRRRAKAAESPDVDVNVNE